MGSDSAPVVDKGCKITNSAFVGLWEVFITRSALNNVSFTMAELDSDPHNIVPVGWIENQTKRPSWQVMLNSNRKIWPDMLNAFPTYVLVFSS